MAHYMVNSKVFETEQEAIEFSRDLMSRGGIGGWSETTAPVTHHYLGNSMTEPIEDYFELNKEAKNV